MNKTPLIQVLGAIAYGEHKAHTEAKAAAAATDDPAERAALRRIAADELRHHRAFVARLEALGADPERAMRPYRRLLDRYHGEEPSGEVEAAVWSFLGEGIADDLLEWLEKVVDPDTAVALDRIRADEVGHNDHAIARLRALLAAEPDGRRRALVAVATMARRMATSGGQGPLPLGAFLRVGRPVELVAIIGRGFLRRVGALVGPARQEATCTPA